MGCCIFIINRLSFDLLYFSCIFVSPYSLFFNLSALANFPVGVTFHGSNIINYYRNNADFAEKLREWVRYFKRSNGVNGYE